MKQFHAITEKSIAKLKIVGINADQLDQLVQSSTLECNAIADLLYTSHHMVSQNADTKLSIPKGQLSIVSDAIMFYRKNSKLDDYTTFDTHSLAQLFSGDYKVDVELTDSNWDFLQKSGVDIPEYIECAPTGSCLNSICRKSLYNDNDFCDDNCENEYDTPLF